MIHNTGNTDRAAELIIPSGEKRDRPSEDFCPHAVSVIQHAYYAIRGVRRRRRAYDASVWEEKDPYVLLMKVTPMVARSIGASLMLMPRRQFIPFLLGFIYFRVQDTYADVCIGGDQRIAGLRLLPTRLQQLMDGECPGPNDVSAFAFDLSVERNIAYVDIVYHVQRFDDIFTALPAWAQQALFDFVTQLTEGSIELESLAEAPRTPEYLRRHSEVSIEYGLVCALRLLQMNELVRANGDPNSEDHAMQAWCDYLHLAGLISSIEQDIREGCILDDAFRTKEGLQPDVLEEVRRKWTRSGVQRGRAIAPFVLHTSLRRSYSLRMVLLHITLFTLNTYDAAYARIHSGLPPARPSVYRLLLRGMLKSLTWRGYRGEMEDVVRRLQSYRGLESKNKEESCAPQ